MRAFHVPPYAAHPIDELVGARVRQRRREMGLSQSTVAEKLGLTFQQIQKYERGRNRISASKLFEIAKLLQTPVSWFFPPMAAANDAGPPPPTPDMANLADEAEIATVWRQVPQEMREVLLNVLKATYEEEPNAWPQ